MQWSISGIINIYEMHREYQMTGTTKSQLDRFKEAARQLETDDDEERFDEKLKRLARQKPDEKQDD